MDWLDQEISGWYADISYLPRIPRPFRAGEMTDIALQRDYILRCEAARKSIYRLLKKHDRQKGDADDTSAINN
jgi:hypothetical protein